MNPSCYACPGAPCALTVLLSEVCSGKVEGTTGTLSVLLPTQQLTLSRSYIWVMIPQQSPDNGSLHHGGIGHTLLSHIQTPESAGSARHSLFGWKKTPGSGYF